MRAMSEENLWENLVQGTVTGTHSLMLIALYLCVLYSKGDQCTYLCVLLWLGLALRTENKLLCRIYSWPLYSNLQNIPAQYNFSSVRYLEERTIKN